MAGVRRCPHSGHVRPRSAPERREPRCVCVCVRVWEHQPGRPPRVVVFWTSGSCLLLPSSSRCRVHSGSAVVFAGTGSLARVAVHGCAFGVCACVCMPVFVCLCVCVLAGWLLPDTVPGDGLTLVPQCGAFSGPHSGVGPTPKESLRFGGLSGEDTQEVAVGGGGGWGSSFVSAVLGGPSFVQQLCACPLFLPAPVVCATALVCGTLCAHAGRLCVRGHDCGEGRGQWRNGGKRGC